MWVQLKSIKHIEVAGQMRTYRPGDWVDVGKQTALQWLALGDAWTPELDVAEFMDTGDAGILCVGAEGEGGPAAQTAVSAYSQHLGTAVGALGDGLLRWSKTLIWDGLVPIRVELLPVGFGLLDTWQVACPLVSYETLACDLGEDGDKARTRAVVHDLRVPLYHPGMVFVKRCQDTEYLVDAWREERVGSGGRFHSFLRAVYRARPLILALPMSWLDRGAVMGGEDG